MTENKFRNGPYEDALQFTKNVLSISSSIDEIMINADIKEETKEEMEERLSNYK
ncbi:hypothetical protein [Romboutsia maritimum]|uniref:hypothetical protein n=1 Tax=Romboutsia maritimum TaxID=2020948 RepID=UPI0013144FB8|nr:hypothetical protein [Romboutsia maritimum]